MSKYSLSAEELITRIHQTGGSVETQRDGLWVIAQYASDGEKPLFGAGQTVGEALYEVAQQLGVTEDGPHEEGRP